MRQRLERTTEHARRHLFPVINLWENVVSPSAVKLHFNACIKGTKAPKEHEITTNNSLLHKGQITGASNNHYEGNFLTVQSDDTSFKLTHSNSNICEILRNTMYRLFKGNKLLKRVTLGHEEPGSTGARVFELITAKRWVTGTVTKKPRALKTQCMHWMEYKTVQCLLRREMNIPGLTCKHRLLPEIIQFIENLEVDSKFPDLTPKNFSVWDFIKGSVFSRPIPIPTGGRCEVVEPSLRRDKISARRNTELSRAGPTYIPTWSETHVAKPSAVFFLRVPQIPALAAPSRELEVTVNGLYPSGGWDLSATVARHTRAHTSYAACRLEINETRDMTGGGGVMEQPCRPELRQMAGNEEPLETSPRRASRNIKKHRSACSLIFAADEKCRNFNELDLSEGNVFTAVHRPLIPCCVQRQERGFYLDRQKWAGNEPPQRKRSWAPLHAIYGAVQIADGGGPQVMAEWCNLHRMVHVEAGGVGENGVAGRRSSEATTRRRLPSDHKESRYHRVHAVRGKDVSKFPLHNVRACSGDQDGYVLHRKSGAETYRFPATNKTPPHHMLNSPTPPRPIHSVAWPARSPEANRVQFPAGSPLDVRMWASYGTMPLVGGFSRGSPVCPAFILAKLHTHFNNSHRLSRPRCYVPSHSLHEFGGDSPLNSSGVRVRRLYARRLPAHLTAAIMEGNISRHQTHQGPLPWVTPVLTSYTALAARDATQTIGVASWQRLAVGPGPCAQARAPAVQQVWRFTNINAPPPPLSLSLPEQGGAVVTHWTRIREDTGSIPGPAILISAFYRFPKSLQANDGMGP
ncbi:hypothetical protein PR048_023628 [Dryococelus australis]|uniref:Uncharacterized protein n=1 Tax=Dryococelus australis TaxID=614101 RepID=A0ABQ9GUP2_9NEOP|nr:hypothetical protein PR048_023628 [Dryococelus australis]